MTDNLTSTTSVAAIDIASRNPEDAPDAGVNYDLVSASVMGDSVAYGDLRTLVRAYQDAQRIRLAHGNRVIQAALKAGGIDALVKMGEEDPRGAELRDKILEDFDALLTAAAARYAAVAKSGAGAVTPKFFAAIAVETKTPHGLLSRFFEFQLCAQMRSLESMEAVALKSVERALNGMRIWTEFLEGVKGAGPALAGAVLAEIDITKAEYPSSLWRLAGYDVGPDGRGRSRRGEHLVDVTYKDAAGREAVRKSITFNPNLKTKLFVMAQSFLKVGVERSPYAKVYYDTKHRLEHHVKYGLAAQAAFEAAPEGAKPEYKPTPGHRHSMAMRAAIKRFLVDLYTAWRTVEGLPVAPEYSVAKLGMVHKSADKYAA